MAEHKHIPFQFVLDYLLPVNPRIKPFFGSYAVYVGEKIVFNLRDKKKRPDCNGIWIATTLEHHKSLKKELPSMCSVDVLNGDSGKETGWQMLKAEDDDFESLAIRACELILRGDPRIGKIPKPKKKKNASSKHSKGER